MAQGNMTMMAVIRKVLSAHDFPKQTITQITRPIRDLDVNSLEEAYNASDEFRRYMDTHREQYDIMLKLEGLMSHESKHAAGVVITPKNIDEYIPCGRGDDGGLKTQWDLDSIEEIGGYKFDLLALKTLSVIRIAIDYIDKSNVNWRSIMNSIDNEDEGVYKLLRSGNLTGIFQFDKPSGKSAIERINPTKFEDVVAATALCRPGVKDAHLYYSNKELYEKDNTYPVPEYWNLVKSVLSKTYGAIVYQEQYMLLMNELAGWSLGKADSMRKVKNLEDYRDDFVSGCNKNGINSSIANKIFDTFDMGYSFNRSHAVSYSYISCICAWLKHYYPKEFLSALMTIESLKTDNNLNEQIREAQRLGIKILTPDIRYSRFRFVPTEEGIAFGLTAIKSVGDRVPVYLDENNVDPIDIINNKDGIDKRVLNKRTVTNLIKAGAFDYISINRCELLKQYYSARGEEISLPTWSKDICMAFENKVLGMYVTYTPLDNHNSRELSRYKDGSKVSMNGIISSVKTIVDRRGNKMAFVTIENHNESIELVVFSSVYSKCNPILVENMPVEVTGTKDDTKILADKIDVLR